MKSRLRWLWRLASAAIAFNLGVVTSAFLGSHVPGWVVAAGVVLGAAAVTGYVANR